jgi:6-phosphofructokinase 1
MPVDHPVRPGQNALYAQAGGTTAVINVSAAGVIRAWQALAPPGARLFAAKDGVLGLLTEQLLDLTHLAQPQIQALEEMPSAIFGTCRHLLQPAEHERLLAVLAAHDIGYFIYNGGGGSALACLDIITLTEKAGFPLQVIHAPKTIDNDLPGTDCCPGFGSAAKYLATSMREAALDLAAMAGSSSKVFLLETMGRYSGWLTAACGLSAQGKAELAPHILLVPERPFEIDEFMARVQATVEQYGHCAVAVSEGLKDSKGRLMQEIGRRDAAGDRQLGGVAPWLAQEIRRMLGYKCHWSVADYLQRSARHLASAVDVEQAAATGQHAVKLALAGGHGQSAIVERLADAPYRWQMQGCPIATLAETERHLPLDLLTADGFHLSAAGRRYFAPLIQGESYPAFRDGLPAYDAPVFTAVAAKLPAWQLEPQ